MFFEDPDTQAQKSSLDPKGILTTSLAIQWDHKDQQHEGKKATEKKIVQSGNIWAFNVTQ